MNKSNHVNIDYINFAKIFFGVAIFLMMAFLFVGEVIFPDERDMGETDCQIFEAQWEQVLENGERIPIEVPGSVPAKYGEVITIVTTLPKDLNNDDVISFRPIWQDVDIYIDGEHRVSYSTEDTRPFGLNSAFRHVFVELNEEDAGKELFFCFSSNSKYAGVMRTSYIGDRIGIWTYFIEENGAGSIIAVMLFLLSLACIIVCAIFKMVYKKELPLIYLGWTIFLCSTWILSENEFRQLIVKNISILTSCTYWSLMLLPFPIIIYINAIQNGYYKKLYFIPLTYAGIMLAVGTGLQIFDKIQFVQQLPFVHAGLIMSTIFVITTITIDVFTKRIGEYLPVSIGIYGMLFTAVVEMILYYADWGVSLGTVLLIGLMFLLIMAIIKTGQDLLRGEKKRQQAVMAKEAQAKFLASMSHEIRTPINAVIGMNEMILREGDNETVMEYARNIQSASNMLLGLVNDILDFSKIESGQLELVEDKYSLAPLIKDEVLLLNARAIGKPISTHLDINPQLPSMYYGDELRIKQVLTNLLSNAVKYTKEGQITLKVSYKALGEDMAELRFDVIDTGVGIKKEDIPKLFDSFVRFELNRNRNVEGTGLGLNIAKQLVDLMQGTIEVESEYGKGSTFTVRIPQRIVDKRPVGNIGATILSAHKEDKKHETVFTAPGANILVVDDNVMNLSVVKALLKRTEIAVDTATSGKESLELSKNKHYDIILMDHMMPELDGVETLKKLRTDYSNINQSTKVIVLTANAIAGCREMYLEYGFDDYLSKPIQADKLDEVLMEYIPKKLVHMSIDTEQKAAEQNEHKAMVENAVTKQLMEKGEEEAMLYIDKELGLKYCLESEEMYKEFIEAFIEQVNEYLPQLETEFANSNWEQYGIIAHAIKSNALNIGAANFSKYSLQHEMAGKEADAGFILSEYSKYVTTLKKLIEKLEQEINT